MNLQIQILLVAMLLVSSSCGFIIQTEEVNQNRLQFSNFTDNYSEKFINDFIKWINAGSGFFKNDNQRKLAYIADSLNQLYPVANRSYSVFTMNGTLTPGPYIHGWSVRNS